MRNEWKTIKNFEPKIFKKMLKVKEKEYFKVQKNQKCTKNK